MRKQSTTDQSSYGRPFVDYYPMPDIPPRRGGHTIRDPHGSEAAFAKWTTIAAGKDCNGGSGSRQQLPGAAEEETMDMPGGGGGGKEHRTEERETSKEPIVAEAVVIDATGDEEVVAVTEYNTAFAGGEVVQVEELETETYVIQGGPKVSKPQETAANTVAQFKTSESRVQKGPVCIPPDDS
ncbi:hypothetical protein PG994_007934 [Apiospora phragmitis]|uniref:Hypervirulence associated protein TUDOR domain-containing protein n=1 Tax=Apiospora phragmitis TaxID=2905665 RepID=A0ABR1URL5_9PEZI